MFFIPPVQCSQHWADSRGSSFATPLSEVIVNGRSRSLNDVSSTSLTHTQVLTDARMGQHEGWNIWEDDPQRLQVAIELCHHCSNGLACAAQQLLWSSSKLDPQLHWMDLARLDEGLPFHNL